MVPEARLEATAHGLVPRGDGWFVLNAREAPWSSAQGRGASCRFEGERPFPQLGLRLNVVDAMVVVRKRARGSRRGVVLGTQALGLEPVADPEVGVDVGPAGRGLLDLRAQLAHEYVDRPVPVDHPVAPHARVDVLALEDAPLRAREQVEGSNSRRVRSMLRPATKAWNWSGRSSSSPRTSGPSSTGARVRLRRVTASMRAKTSSG